MTKIDVEHTLSCVCKTIKWKSMCDTNQCYTKSGAKGGRKDTRVLIWDPIGHTVRGLEILDLEMGYRIVCPSALSILMSPLSSDTVLKLES